MKKLEIEKTKPTFIISVLKVDILKVGLVFSIFHFFITRTSLANNWRRKKIPSCSYSALVHTYYPCGMYALHCRKENSHYYYVMYHQRLKGPCKKAPLSNIMHICFGKGFPIHLLLVFSSVRRTNSFTNFKGGLISEGLSLWLQSSKKCAKSLS